jgi:D-beta-D-heptose 7-phosphate kinase / D-beta-D-heptose 1-phosphate adenosyltransferase
MNASLLDIVKTFPGMRVTVIGDAMLDCYLEGTTNRLCREAPVPVVTVGEQRLAPGGASNTALNVQTLGGQVNLLSVIGDDADGRLLCEALAERSVGGEYILAHPGRRTLAKRRVIASGHMLVRYDEGSTGPLDPETEQAVMDRLDELFPQSDALIISDYGYGVLSPRVIARIAELQSYYQRVIVADAKDLALYREVGITAVKPNYGEAVSLLGLARLEGACARAEQIAPFGERVLDLTGARMAAVTLDSEGALVFERGSLPYRTYAQPTPDSHAAGAGDTFVAALTLALLAGADRQEAAEIASAAATVVVRRDGTTTCSAAELGEYFSLGDKYASDLDRLVARLESERRGCRRVVFTNGCFDILHSGHIAYLNQAKALGDILVLGVNTDESVRRLKGPARPINSLDDRVKVLSALSSIDYIIAFDQDTPIELIRALRPDVFVKGGDYTRDTLPEAPVVEALGGAVQILPYIEDHSTTGMIARIREAYALPAESVAGEGTWQ